MGQTFLLLYLAITFLIGPLFLEVYPMSLRASLILGSVITFLIYLPTLVYFAKERRFAGCAGTVIAFGLVYGATDFLCARGVWDCLRNRSTEWIPTNSQCHDRGDLALLAEALFGTLLLCVPALAFPALLYIPCSVFFAAKFLFGPAMSLLYDDGKTWARPLTMFKPPPSTTALMIIAVLALGVLALSHANNSATERAHVEIRDKDIYVAGRKFLVKGVSYGPWRPKTGPNKGYPYPSPKEIDEDLQLIRKLSANTILVYDSPDYVLDLAQQHGFKVLYTFSVNWWSIGSAEFSADQQKILQRVEQLRRHPALLAWVLGNEIPGYALDQRGEETIRKGLEDLYHTVKARDNLHPITYSNWPPAKNLNLSFLDFISFNLYPLWPPEVVAKGYGNYIKEVLQPIAGNKPLLMTEYGVNSIEAGQEGQARLIKQCWQDLLQAGASGGMAFEFADQWWKNYDNPRRAGDWWNRASAPDDEMTNDLDPEENYGLMTAYREPKPAYSVVAQIYADAPTETSRTVPLVITALLVLIAFATWLWAKRNTRPLPSSLSAPTKSTPVQAEVNSSSLPLAS
jgi:hypothetical protein